MCPPNDNGTPGFSDLPTALHHTITISVLSRVQAEPEPDWAPMFKVNVYKFYGELSVFVKYTSRTKSFKFKKLKVSKAKL